MEETEAMKKTKRFREKDAGANLFQAKTIKEKSQQKKAFKVIR